jgi:RHS repeat-associated protein
MPGNLTLAWFLGFERNPRKQTSPTQMLSRNTLNRVTNMADAVRNTVYGYDAAGQMLSEIVLWPNDGMSFTDLNRLRTGLSGASPTANPWMHSYAYDAAGNLLTRQRVPLANNKVAYTLNSLNQITNSLLGGQGIYGWTPEITVSGSTTTPATTVTVNGQAGTLFADNSFAQSGFVVTNGLNSFTAMAANTQGLCSTNTSVVTVNITNSAYAYDLNGNLLTDGTRCFAYDDENELISVWATNVWRNDFVYDGKLRRRIERDFTWSGGAWAQTNEIHFIYDGNLVVQERNTNNQPVVEYTRGKDLSGSFQGAGGIGGLLARSQDSLPPTPFYMAHSYYHADGNGNVTMLINASQTMAAKYLYDAFGNTLAQSGYLAAANTYRFSSKEWNANSGLYYYLYRFYDPNLQRWPNEDPLGDEATVRISAKKANSLYAWKLRSEGFQNLYEFNHENPNGFIDKDGRQIALPIGVVIGVGIVVGIIACDAIPWCRQHVLHLPPISIPLPKSIPCPAEPPYPKECDTKRDQCIDSGQGQDCFSCWRECQSSGSWPDYKCDSGGYK